MRDATYIRLMKLLPKSALSSLIGTLTRSPAPAGLHQLAMRGFARRYGVRIDEAELELHQYPTFAEFFARRLKPGLRPVEGGEQVVVAPVDGTASQIGYAERGQCLQAKGISYTLQSLLQDKAAASQFEGGAFATLYLSPRDYHRVHSPLSGAIEGYTYIPGEFWPVNPTSVRIKPDLFCRNERLIHYLRTLAGRCAVVQVGATCVARIRASYDALVTHSRQPARTNRYPTPIPISKGEELGVFEMGSTVILLFEKGRIRWVESLVPGASVRVGRRIGEVS
jgi:phosphatidylserine decarboxylase